MVLLRKSSKLIRSYALKENEKWKKGQMGKRHEKSGRREERAGGEKGRERKISYSQIILLMQNK